MVSNGPKLKSIKNKKLRDFYERQNQCLDDWIEVDTLVMSIADDILDSMNPDAGMFSSSIRSCS